MGSLSTRQQLVKRVRGIAQTRLDADNASLFSQFVDQLIHVHPDESQLDWEPEANFGVLYGLFRFACKRGSDESLLTVFNPDLEADGWVSKHTVIYYCQSDMSFLVDSLRIALNKEKLGIHLFESVVMRVHRDAGGLLVDAQAPDGATAQSESLGFILIDATSDIARLSEIKAVLKSAFTDVSLVVSDFEAMLGRVDNCIAEAEANSSQDEELAFLHWLREGNFTFLGMSDFLLSRVEGEQKIVEQAGQQLGVLRKRELLPESDLAALGKGFADFYAQSSVLAFTKASHKSTVHRHVYADYVVIKRFANDGKVVGETRILGLYTASMYFQSVSEIPLLRSKARWLTQHSQLDNASHNGKTFASILERHPRDDLIQASQEELLETLLSTWKVYERRTVRLLVRYDRFDKFVSCIVHLPREAVKQERQIEKLLSHAIGSNDCELTTQFLAESVLARIRLVFRVGEAGLPDLNVTALEREISELCRDWNDRFTELCVERLGEEHGRQLAIHYGNAFSASYQERFSPWLAVNDIELCERLNGPSDISISLFHEVGAQENLLRLKLFHREVSLQLSDILPLLENLGSRVLVEHPYEICPDNNSLIWMHDFSLEHAVSTGQSLNIDAVRDTYEDALRAIWRGEAENDSFNRLVFAARLDWRSVALLRAYARYFKQLGSPFSMHYIAQVLVDNVDICRDLMALFRCLFDPRRSEVRSAEDKIGKLHQRIHDALDEVQNLNEDQVLRHYLHTIEATLRTNFFQQDNEGRQRSCIALKIHTRELSFAPEPRPEFEIYVYSPRVEGVHLRGGKVARGGIRWSDRVEDFRTEVLGLVKAQQVKNAVIVPTGAKGGFVARKAAGLSEREEIFAEGVACYQQFIRSLLDITDNRRGADVIHPEGVVCRDDDDPYLVVAADKGTASFSDIANDIALDYGFWLGDAFASGGSHGYDHKAMGITARGAWVAVQRHFRELGINIQEQPFTAIGIGDMGGDVFGNGMLLSQQTRLVAAFNHLHIFIDPNPDALSSWRERKRLFEKPNSSWTDYDRELISVGGGVFSRSAKHIELSSEMQNLLGTEEKQLSPNDLIKTLLQAEVDLIWNGGIGTYVKSATETNADVGDRSNDSLRVNGRQLRCKVFGEGGNLGMTQLGRMEFCRAGGICNTDFIDNSAGVDCSDHEVNIKILLNAQLESDDLTFKQRNQLLVDMTGEVSELVLRNNYRQTQAISLAQFRREKHHHDYLRFLEYLEGRGRLVRALEFIPDNDSLAEYRQAGTCWTRPELSVLVSYAKVDLKEQLLHGDLLEDPWLARRVYRAFPRRLWEQYGPQIIEHRLSREIVATQLANEMVNLMGFTYCMRQEQSIGASPAKTAKAFVVVMALFELDALWAEIEKLDHQVASSVQYELLHQIMRLGRRSTRWFLRNKHDLSPEQAIQQMQAGFNQMLPVLSNLQSDNWMQVWQAQVQAWQDAGVPQAIAERVASFDAFFLLPGCIDAALEIHVEAQVFVSLVFRLIDRLCLDWALQQLIAWQPDGRWQDLARESYVDNIEVLVRKLAIGLLGANRGSGNDAGEGRDMDSAESQVADATMAFDQWQQKSEARINRYLTTINAVKTSVANDLSVFTVVQRELQDLVEGSLA
ncbi:NAD-glutamate dehydrogenase [Spongiibacter sp. KMU-158]|uniref:NAD-glutamate dehydrogenase n=1 Tax=Spongiibacter pelagi TaxID=2760804 RepID=A0A927C4K9_9GAMM|nr:NAD-glutamate dehydrogenase [Spongiibacter pelagi]MBD2859782.1 NAD-glutamate dehydrogenase [Spongiibacter pelagi]